MPELLFTHPFFLMTAAPVLPWLRVSFPWQDNQPEVFVRTLLPDREPFGSIITPAQLHHFHDVVRYTLAPAIFTGSLCQRAGPRLPLKTAFNL